MYSGNFVLLFLLSSLQSARSSRQDNEAYMEGVLSHVNNMLASSFDALNSLYSASVRDSTCSFSRACNTTKDFGAFSNKDTYSVDAQFKNLSISRDEILIKKSVDSLYVIDEEEKKDLCAIHAQHGLWSNHLSNNPEGIVWQYVGMPKGSIGFYPAFQWNQSDCPGDFRPQARPWYAYVTLCSH